jgi:uncharacterized protein YecE (DUF72 family)
MDRECVALPPRDIRFGASGLDFDGFSPETGRLATAEVSYDEWLEVTADDDAAKGSEKGVEKGAPLSSSALPSVLSPALPPVFSSGRGDFCVRLGEKFAFPREYDAARMAECRRRAEAGVEKGRLGALLLEFPSSCAYSAEARRHLDRVLRELAGLPLAVFFFNASWYSVRVIEGLKERGAALCLADMPRLSSAPPVVDVVTAPLIYIKFYGRAAAAWGRRGAQGPGTRVEGGEDKLPDYDYTREELAAWLPRLDALADQADSIRVIFAARRGGAGARNAALFADMWRARTETRRAGEAR